MNTGSLSAGVCYESALLATDAYFGNLVPVSYHIGSSLVTISYIQVAGVWEIQKSSIDALGVSSVIYTVPALIPPYAPCYAPSESFADGVNIGWALAIVFGVVFFVKTISGVFKNV